MTLTIISPDFFHPLSSIKLGRLVKSIDFPIHSYHDPPYSQPPEGAPTVRSQYRRILQDERSAGFASKLTSLLSSGFSKRANRVVRIETNVVKTYTLDNSEAWFTEATGLEGTRKWIERAIGGDGIYLVVGFHTVSDARIVHESVQGHQLTGQATLPVGLSLAAVGVVAPLGNIVDPAVGGNKTVLDGAKTQFIAPGEQICALQYIKISYQWLHSKKIENLKLSKWPRWTAGEGWRKTSSDKEDEPDLLEVRTEELKMPEGDWEHVTEGDEIILLRSAEEDEEF
jgi:hypothetical protein